MASLFETYEREYLSSTRTAAQNIEQIPELLPGHAREEMVSKTATAIQSAEEVVQQMELEARSVQGEERRQLTAQAKDYKASIGALKEQLKAAKNSHKTEELARAELLRNTDQAHRGEAETQHARLLASTERLQRGTDKLKAACQIAGPGRVAPSVRVGISR